MERSAQRRPMGRAIPGDARGGRPTPRRVGTERRDGESGRPSRTLAALVASVAAGAYIVGGAALAGHAGPALSRDAYPFLPVAALVVVGLPVALYLRHDRRGPLALLAAVVAFWHLYVPLFEGSVIETPTFVLALYFAPVYLGAYLLASASERRVRAGRERS